MAKLPYDERVQLLEENRIDILQFVMDGEEADDFLSFCRERGIDPTPEAAGIWIDICDVDVMAAQFNFPEDYA